MKNPFFWKIPLPNPFVWRLPRFGLRFAHPLRIRFSIWDGFFWSLIAVFMASLVPLFFWVVEPSLVGKNGLRIGADSSVYLWYAGLETDRNLLRHAYGIDAPKFTGDLTLAVLFASGGNFLGPVLIAIALRSNFLIMLFNYLLFFLSLYYLWKRDGVRRKLLITLLLLNPITIVSLLTLNKEIFALLAAALLSYYVASQEKSLTLLAAILLVSLLARWEQAVFTLVFLLLISRWNPLREHRVLTVALILGVISVVTPLIPQSAAPLLMTDTESFGTVMRILNWLQAHFLFFVAVWPKVLMNFGPLFNISRYKDLDWHDVQNSLMVVWSEAVMLGVTIAMFAAGRVKLKRDLIYFSLLFLLATSVLSFIQLRYVYPVYVLACLEIATPLVTGNVPAACRS